VRCSGDADAEYDDQRPSASSRVPRPFRFGNQDVISAQVDNSLDSASFSQERYRSAVRMRLGLKP
jgi:hypothetical protein